MKPNYNPFADDSAGDDVMEDPRVLLILERSKMKIHMVASLSQKLYVELAMTNCDATSAARMCIDKATSFHSVFSEFCDEESKRTLAEIEGGES